MSIFQQPKVFSKIFYSWTVLFICVGLVIFIVNQAASFYIKNDKVVDKLKVNKEKISKLEKELDRNKEKLQLLNTKRGQEEYVRNTYPVAKDSEQVILIYNATESPIEIIATSTNVWIEIKNKFFFFIDNYTNL